MVNRIGALRGSAPVVDPHVSPRTGAVRSALDTIDPVVATAERPGCIVVRDDGFTMSFTIQFRAVE